MTKIIALLAMLAACGGTQPDAQPIVTPSPTVEAKASKHQSDPKVTPTAGTEAEPSASDEDAPEPEPEPLVSKLPPVDFVTPLSLDKVTDKAKRDSKKMNTIALRLHRLKKYPEAEKAYKEALVLDPGNLLARYNLACVYNLTAQSNRGLALLFEIAKLQCKGCATVVSHAEWDEEWQSHWMEPVLWEILAASDISTVREQSWDDWEERSEFKCPRGTRVKGMAPEDSVATGSLWCAKPNGVKHGRYISRGSASSADETTVTDRGHYRSGKKHGHWSEDPTHVSNQSGHYKNGKRHGRWRASEGIGDTTQYTAYVDGVRHGRHAKYQGGGYSNYDWNDEDYELLSSGAYHQGKLHGVWTDYHDIGGKRRLHAYDRGVPNGAFEFWDEDDKSLARFEMKQGNGNWVVYDQRGLVMEKGKLTDNKKQGAWLERKGYDKEKETGSYKDDNRVGQWSRNYRKDKKDGKKMWQGHYKRGKKTGEWSYWSDEGTLTAKGTYKDGLPHGKWVIDDTNVKLRSGRLIRVEGSRPGPDMLRGYRYYRESFPMNFEPLTEEDLELYEGEY